MTETEKSSAARSVMTVREQAADQRATRACRLLAGALCCLFLSVGGNVFQAALPKFVPQQIVVDPQGIVLWQSRNGELTPEQVEVGALLKKWIWNSRRRGDDALLMGEMRREAELMTTGKALRKLQQYHAATNPKCQAQSPECQELKRNPIRTQMDGFKITRLTDQQWVVEWKEDWTPTYGEVTRNLHVRGEFTVERRLTPGPFGRVLMTIRDANRSPLGVYVIDYWLSERWEEARH